MAEEIKMLPIRQKEIVDKIKLAGFRQSDFNFNPLSNEWFILQYKQITDYHISVKDKKHSIVPAANGELYTTGETANWQTAMLRLNYWLKALKENIEAGNPWEEIENAKEQMHEMNFDSYEEIFNADEQEKIEKKLDLLLSKIEKLEIDTTIIKQDIEHLNTMSGKISKKDWILLLLGTVTGWIFTGIMTTEHTQTIWEAVKTIFSGFKLKFLA